jgi:hypothetical protein
MQERVKRSEPLPQGEDVHLLERLVVAEHRGRFRPLDDDLVGTVVTDGQLIGVIERRGGSHPIMSRFCGRLMGMLVHPKEMVDEGAAIAWLRVIDESEAAIASQAAS